MKIKKMYSVLAFVILITACGNKKVQKFYSNGQLKEEIVFEKKSDTAKYLIVNYYPNGQIKSEGKVINGIKCDNWQEWYADGSIKWVGRYKNGNRSIELSFDKPIIILKDSILRKSNATYLKIYLEGVHPEDMAIACNNGIVKSSPNKDLFDYVLIPKNEGFIKLFIFVKNGGKMEQISIDSLYVNPR